MCRESRGAPSAPGLVSGLGFRSPSRPDKGRNPTYRAGSRRKLWCERPSCYHRRQPGQPSGESRLKTVYGLELGGLVSHPEGEEIDHVPAGQEVDVSFQIKITLLPGTYFGNSGVLGMGGDEMVFLHRCVDACISRVQPRAGMLLTGMVDVSAGKPGSVSITPQRIHHVTG